jgi:signal peptidase II
MKSTVAFIAAAVGGIFCDVISKWLVFSKLDDYKSVTLIPGFLNILRSKNEGVVFGLLPGKTNAFIILSIIAIIAILCIFFWSNNKLFITNLALGFVLAGAAGNLWDRFHYRYVRDFIDIHIGEKYHWPTFNVADSLICIGIFFMIITSFPTHKTSQSVKSPS